MSKLLDRLILVTLCLLGGVLAIVFIPKGWNRVHLVPVVRAQSNPEPGIKTVVVNKTRQLDPIEVTQILEGGKEVLSSDPSQADSDWMNPKDLPVLTSREFRDAYKFSAGEDWLKDLEVVLRNRTSKNIVRVALEFRFPETTANGPTAGTRIRFGQLPSNVAFLASGDPIPPGPEPTLEFSPGKAMGFNFVSHDYQLRAAVEHGQPFSTVALCYIHFAVVFDDGINWTEAGGYAAPDPQRPGWFLPPDEAYFPGPLMGPPASTGF
ncbi:MAG: hypothetical protein WAO35_22550 [Terriglobia bacterium]